MQKLYDLFAEGDIEAIQPVMGVSLTVKLKRGTRTRDQDEVIAKAKGKTLEDAREDMETLREYIHDLAEENRYFPGIPLDERRRNL